MRKLALLLALVAAAPLVAAHDAKYAPDLSLLGDHTDGGIFVPWVTSGTITTHDVDAAANWRTARVDTIAQGQYGHFRLDVTMWVRYVADGTLFWRTETVCARSVENTNYIGVATLSASCTGATQLTPRPGFGILYWSDAYMYEHTTLFGENGWAGLNSQGDSESGTA